MKLNADCIRDILIAVEEKPYGEAFSGSNLCEKFPCYTRDEIEYACLKLDEAGLLNVVAINAIGQKAPSIARVNELTFVGHEFLEDIRSDTTWNKTKEVAKSVGSESLHALKDIAVGVVTAAIQGKLGLS